MRTILTIKIVSTRWCAGFCSQVDVGFGFNVKSGLGAAGRAMKIFAALDQMQLNRITSGEIHDGLRDFAQEVASQKTTIGVVQYPICLKNYDAGLPACRRSEKRSFRPEGTMPRE